MVREAEDGGQYEQQADGVHADCRVVSQLGMSGLLYSPATTETGTRWPDCRRGPGEDWGHHWTGLSPHIFPPRAAGTLC